MKTLTEEQFKQKYGERAALKVEQLETNRFPDRAASKDPFLSKFNKAIGLDGATDVFGRLLARSGVGGQNAGQKQVSELTGMSQQEINQANIPKPTGKEVAGAVAQTAAVPLGAAITGGSSVAGQVAAGAGAGYLYDVGQDLIEGKSVTQTLTPGAATIAGGAAPLVLKGLQAGVGALKDPLAKATNAAGDAISNVLPDNATIDGVKQTISDVAERVPRFVARQQENIAEQAAKSQAIQQAPTPAIANAIKVDLPEKFVNTVTQADAPTKAAYKKVIQLAEEVPKSVGVKTNPTIVGGELAGKQYEIIDNQRKVIGQMLNDETAKLSKIESIDMSPAYSQMESALGELKVYPVVTENGFKLDFSKSRLTEKQRVVVRDLFKKATEGGNKMSPLDIREKDQMFSAMQREARADQIEDILINLPDGEKLSLFRAFRDVFSNQLDTLSPEIKKLNSQYRNIATLVEDVEDSIFKTPNFNVTKSTDPSEFAKVNLRRIFGESQSSPAYEAIADEMDAIARQLGYADAKPKDVAAFAQELRELYPEITPRTGFAGGFRAGLSDLAERVFSAGEVSPKDKQAALKALLESTETTK